MTKTKSQQDKKNSDGNSEEPQEPQPNGINQRALFLLVLILSISFNVYLNWNRKSPNQLEEVLEELEKYKKDQQTLGEMVSVLSWMIVT